MHFDDLVFLGGLTEEPWSHEILKIIAFAFPDFSVPYLKSPRRRREKKLHSKNALLSAGPVTKNSGSLAYRGSVAYIIDSRAKRSPRPSRGDGGGGRRTRRRGEGGAG